MKERKPGKLKIFFGYAPGIGKTYAMLASARLAKEEGTDVVLGFIGPHTRPETMALAEGFERMQTISAAPSQGGGRKFNLDGALTRKPQLIIMDELAHRNAKGCRHDKRYQDVRELIYAGIDVYTTVTVHDLEGLNDVIEEITGVTVRERIPDAVFDGADRIEMVDLEPEELIHRLQQEKVLPEREGKSNLHRVGSLEKLGALREIALRRMADRVSLVQEKENGQKSGNEEHILMCLPPSPSNVKVIRQASRMAAAFHGKFTAFYVETPDFAKMSEEDSKRLQANTRLAEQLGAKTIISVGSDIVEQIAEYARIAKVTKIVLGRSYTKRNFFSVRESFSESLEKLAPRLEIFLIPDGYDKKYIRKKKAQKKIIQNQKISSKDYLLDGLLAAAALAAATLLAGIFDYLGFSDANLIMVYILGVLITALAAKQRVTSAAYSIFSVFVFNYCFTDPVKTFSVNDPSYIVTFSMMFLTAIISSSLTEKIKNYAKQTVKKSYRTELLLETSQLLQQAGTETEIMQCTVKQLGQLLERNIYGYLGNPAKVSEPVCYIPQEGNARITDKEGLAVAEWTYRNNKHAGYSTTTLPGSRCLYLAVRNGEKVFGVVEIDMEEREIAAFENSVMNAILNECALALEKEELVHRQNEAAIKLEQEQLRANLLRMISHDLRTPLTSISGSAAILIGNADKIEEQQKRKLYENIYDDSMWLITLVENLLSVTRIENGTMNLKLQAELLEDIINEALLHISRKKEEHEIIINQENDLFVAKMDAKLIVQVIINLVDNAIKYTKAGSKILISTKKQGQDIVVQIADNGAGIGKEQKDHLFEMFYTAKTGNTAEGGSSDSHRGIGLGLALCKSIVEAHGGKIGVYDNIPNGTVFRFTLKAEEVTIV